MRNWMTLPLCLLLAGCTAAAPGTAQTPAPTAAPQTLAVVLDGCIAFEADSAGGSLKTAVAAADMVEYLAGDFVPQDLAGETTASTSGKIMGGYSTCLNLGQFSISLISVPLFAAVGSSYPVMFGVMAVVAIVACLAFVVMSRTGVSGGHGAGA